MRSVALLLLITTIPAFAQDARKAPSHIGPDAKELAQLRKMGVDYLLGRQADDGSWTKPNAPGISALVTTALLKSGLKPDHPAIKKALRHLVSHEKKDGGFYATDSNHRNYETCLTILALTKANKDKRYDKQIAKAVNFLKGLQWDQGEGLSSTDGSFGGAGYGSHERPDMSNTQFFIEALRASGVPEDDTNIQNALKFVSRAQNMQSEHNKMPFAGKIRDGGFYYTPAVGGETKGQVLPNGGLSSYGSMTYAGLKSMVYAGLKSDDKRVKSAFEWIQKNYTLDENPGVGLQGLFYYYHVFGKALSLMKVDYIVDANGKKHDWRKELTSKLTALRSAGFWVNKADRWYEGDPNLVTAYSLMALSYCDPKTKPAAPTAK